MAKQIAKKDNKQNKKPVKEELFELPEVWDRNTRVMELVQNYRNGKYNHLLKDGNRMRVTLSRNIILFNEFEDEIDIILDVLNSFHITGCQVISMERGRNEAASEFHKKVTAVFTYLISVKANFILLLTGYGYGNIPALRAIHEADKTNKPILYVAQYSQKDFEGIIRFKESKQAHITMNNSALIEGVSKFAEFEALKNQNNFIAVKQPWKLITSLFETSVSRLMGRAKEVCLNPKEHISLSKDGVVPEGHICNPSWTNDKVAKLLSKSVSAEKERQSKLEKFIEQAKADEKVVKNTVKNITIINNKINQGVK